ncbi:MAG: hypothetical protein P4L16_01575 [Chlamydiales bacterium]|nr:hypothetical protein [Chlamydiales bacterium]
MSNKEKASKPLKRNEKQQLESAHLKKTSGGKKDTKEPAHHLYHSSTTARGK